MMTWVSLFRVIGIPTILLTFATTVLVIILACSLSIDGWRSHVLTIVASILQLLSSSLLLYLYILYGFLERLRTEAGGRRSLVHLLLHVLGAGVIPSSLAAIIIGFALGWTKASLADMPLHVLGQSTSRFVLVTIAVWGASLLSQMFFFVCIPFLGKHDPWKKDNHVESTQSGPAEIEDESRPAMATRTQLDPLSSDSLTSIPPSLVTSEGTISGRSSLSTIQRPSSSRRPSTSKGRLGNRHSIRIYDGSASGRTSQDSGFDSWDTSSVQGAMRDTVLHSPPATRGKALEPIPGSRSPSPAKALDGPFLDQGPLPDPPASPLPQPTISLPSSPIQENSPSKPLQTIQQQSFQLFSSAVPSAPNFSRPCSSHKPSPNETHIHPLFRTDSPGPTPTASPTTEVMASPFAGQLINQQTLKRMRSGSLPSSPSPLVRSQSFDDNNLNRNSSHQYFVPNPSTSPQAAQTQKFLLDHLHRTVSMQGGYEARNKV